MKDWANLQVTFQLADGGYKNRRSITGAAILGAAFGENTLAPAGITNVLYR